MGVGPDPINMLLVGTIVVVVLALAWDVADQHLAPLLKRYRTRLGARQVRSRAYLPLFGGVILAGLMHLPLVSTYLVFVGLLLTWRGMRRADKERARIAPSQIFQLVLAFRSMYLLRPSVFLTLDTVRDKVDEPLRDLVGIMVQTYNATGSPERAFAELRARTDNVYLIQFAHILEMSEAAPADAVVRALDSIVERLRTHDALHRESRVSLTTITGQTSFMHGVALLSVVLVASIPMLRAPYASVDGQIIFVAVLTVMLGASYYIGRTIDKLAEHIS